LTSGILLFKQRGDLMKLSIIIVTRNRAEMLRKCLDSLVRQTKKPDEVLAVDNNSNDSTKNVIGSFRKRLAIKYIFEPRVGIPIARNTGIKSARYDIIAFIDDDCVADGKYVRNILDEHQKHKNESVILGRSINKVKNNIFAESMDCILKENPYLIDSKNVSFKKWFIKKNLFDEEFLRCSDLELGTRLKKAGLRFYYSPCILAHHTHRPDLKSFMKQQYESGKYHYILKKKYRDNLDLLPKDLKSFFMMGCSLFIMPFVTTLKNIDRMGIRTIYYLPFLFLQKISKYSGFFIYHTKWR